MKLTDKRFWNRENKKTKKQKNKKTKSRRTLYGKQITVSTKKK